MLSVEAAREIADEWRPRFIDEVAFETSWRRFYEMVGDPGADRLITWLAKDQAKDAVMHAGIVKEPLLPVRQQFDLSDCSHCGGKGWFRKELPVGHPEFGKAHRCPDCNR